MQRIDKYYHENKKMEEERKHWEKMAEGEEIRIGENYRGIITRDGQILEENVNALAYDDGTVLFGSLDGADFQSFSVFPQELICHIGNSGLCLQCILTVLHAESKNHLAFPKRNGARPKTLSRIFRRCLNRMTMWHT